MLKPRSSLAKYLNDLQSEGRVSFTSKQAREKLGITNRTFLKAAERLQKQKMLLNPRHGFYVAVPPQYLSWGAAPPAWYIDALMRHEARPYYVGLLKAAELHGATHHAVMEFQVITDKQIPKIRAGRSIIVFYYRKDFSHLRDGITEHKTDSGSMKISSPELTAFDLLRYTRASGGIDAVATVLSDLKDKLDGAKLKSLATLFERSVIQRLGYLLDRLGRAEIADTLHEFLAAKKLLSWVALQPQRRGREKSDVFEKNARWGVIVHRAPEIDE